MSKSTLIEQLLRVPVVIRAEDSLHYLVGTFDGKENFAGIDPVEGHRAFCSFAEVKQYLKNKNIPIAKLVFQSVDDEMCGTKVSPHFADVIEV